MTTRNANRIVWAGAFAVLGLTTLNLAAEDTVKSSTNTTIRTDAPSDRPIDSLGREVTLKGRLVNLEAYITGASSDFEINAMPRDKDVSTKTSTSTDTTAGAKTSTTNTTKTAVGTAGMAGPLAVVGADGITILSRAPVWNGASVGTSNTTKTDSAGRTSTETSTSVDRNASNPSASHLNQDVEVRGKLYERNGIRLLVVSDAR